MCNWKQPEVTLQNSKPKIKYNEIYTSLQKDATGPKTQVAQI